MSVNENTSMRENERGDIKENMPQTGEGNGKMSVGGGYWGMKVRMEFIIYYYDYFYY